MYCLIAAESAIFTIFVVAYLFYIGKSLTGPKPADVLHAPIFYTICLLSSSLTIHVAVRRLFAARMVTFGFWWLLTIVLGGVFLFGTAREWAHLINDEGLTINTNLFGTTYYSLVGLHAFHVTMGLAGPHCGSGLLFHLATRARARRAGGDPVDVLALRRRGLGDRLHGCLRDWKVAEKPCKLRTISKCPRRRPGLSCSPSD